MHVGRTWLSDFWRGDPSDKRAASRLRLWVLLACMAATVLLVTPQTPQYCDYAAVSSATLPDANERYCFDIDPCGGANVSYPALFDISSPCFLNTSGVYPDSCQPSPGGLPCSSWVVVRDPTPQPCPPLPCCASPDGQTFNRINCQPYGYTCRDATYQGLACSPLLCSSGYIPDPNGSGTCVLATAATVGQYPPLPPAVPPFAVASPRPPSPAPLPPAVPLRSPSPPPPPLPWVRSPWPPSPSFSIPSMPGSPPPLPPLPPLVAPPLPSQPLLNSTPPHLPPGLPTMYFWAPPSPPPPSPPPSPYPPPPSPPSPTPPSPPPSPFPSPPPPTLLAKHPSPLTPPSALPRPLPSQPSPAPSAANTTSDQNPKPPPVVAAPGSVTASAGGRPVTAWAIAVAAVLATLLLLVLVAVLVLRCRKARLERAAAYHGRDAGLDMDPSSFAAGKSGDFTLLRYHQRQGSSAGLLADEGQPGSRDARAAAGPQWPGGAVYGVDPELTLYSGGRQSGPTAAEGAAVALPAGSAPRRISSISGSLAISTSHHLSGPAALAALSRSHSSRSRQPTAGSRTAAPSRQPSSGSLAHFVPRAFALEGSTLSQHASRQASVSGGSLSGGSGRMLPMAPWSGRMLPTHHEASREHAADDWVQRQAQTRPEARTHANPAYNQPRGWSRGDWNA